MKRFTRSHRSSRAGVSCALRAVAFAGPVLALFCLATPAHAEDLSRAADERRLEEILERAYRLMSDDDALVVVRLDRSASVSSLPGTGLPLSAPTGAIETSLPEDTVGAGAGDNRGAASIQIFARGLADETVAEDIRMVASRFVRSPKITFSQLRASRHAKPPQDAADALGGTKPGDTGTETASAQAAFANALGAPLREIQRTLASGFEKTGQALSTADKAAAKRPLESNAEATRPTLDATNAVLRELGQANERAGAGLQGAIAALDPLRTIALPLSAALAALCGLTLFVRLRKAAARDAQGTGADAREAGISGVARTAGLGFDTREPRDDGDSRGLSSGTADGASALAHSLRELPAASYAAVFADSYWSQSDGYSAFLWLHGGADQKRAVLSCRHVPWAYLASCARRAPASAGWHLDPSYVDPLPIAHLSNDALVELVRKDVAIWRALPALRRETLALSAIERVRLSLSNTGSAGNAVESAAFARLPASPARSDASQASVIVASEADEHELTAVGESSYDEVRAIASLVWVAKLPLGKREAFAAQIPLPVLASAWRGPKGALDTIRAALSDDRRGALDELLRAGRYPFRVNSLLRIHSALVREWEIPTENAQTSFLGEVA